MFSASGLLSTMGNALPYAIGAAVGHPGRTVVAMCGDGGFTMMMMELATIAKYNLPIKIIILKNNTFGQIKWEQIVMEANPEYGCDLHPIDFAKYAEAVGIPGYTLDKAEDAEKRFSGKRSATMGQHLLSVWLTRTSHRCRGTRRPSKRSASPSRLSVARRMVGRSSKRYSKTRSAR